MRKVIKTDRAPAAIGPYSQAVQVGDLVFTAGQIPLDPVTGDIVGDEITAQTRQVIANLAGILAEVGAGFENVVKSTVYLSDMAHFAEFNGVYGEAFSGESPPARATVAVAGLPLGVLVEIELIIHLPAG